MDLKYLNHDIKRIVGTGLIKLGYVVIFGWLPRNLKIKISIGPDDTGELVIRHQENVETRPISEY